MKLQVFKNSIDLKKIALENDLNSVSIVGVWIENEQGSRVYEIKVYFYDRATVVSEYRNIFKANDKGKLELDYSLSGIETYFNPLDYIDKNRNKIDFEARDKAVFEFLETRYKELLDLEKKGELNEAYFFSKEQKNETR